MSALAHSFFVSHGTSLHSLDAASAPYQALRSAGARALEGGKLRAVVVLSAHWYSPSGAPTGVGASLAPATVHDHPSQHMYSFRYPAAGDAALSARVAALLTAAGFPSALEPGRGLDHGAWLALELLLPGAPLPVVPVALPACDDDAAMLRFGQALAPLRAEGVLLLCSGAATHSQSFFRTQLLSRALGWGGDEAASRARRVALAQAEATVAADAPWSVAFDAWLSGALAMKQPAERAATLLRHAAAPGAALAHPEPSHLLPALVFAGTAGEDTLGSQKVAAGYQYGLSMSAFRFGDAGRQVAEL